MAEVTNYHEELLKLKALPIATKQADYDPNAQPWINQVSVVRTSESFSRFEGRFAYGKNDYFWDTAKDVNGSRTYLANEHGVSIGCGTASGDAYYDITRGIFFYQPDTVVHSASAILLNTETNVRKFWGMVSYQSNAIQDGFLLRNEGGLIQFVKVSSTSGSPVETIHLRGNWHDPMDGTGPSKVNLDFSKVQMAEISYAWYGGGTAFLLFRLDGKSYVADWFSGANEATAPINGNPNLSVMYGVENLDTVSTPPTFKHWGLSVSADGKKQETGQLYGVASDPVTVSGGAWSPVLSIRLKSTFSIDGAASKSNVYGYITELLATVFSTGRDSVIAIVRDAALTGASFGNIPDIAGAGVTASMVEYDTTASAFSGGYIVYPRALPSGSYVEIEAFVDELISLNALGTEQPIISIAARPQSGGNASIAASFSWREVF